MHCACVLTLFEMFREERCGLMNKLGSLHQFKNKQNKGEEKPVGRWRTLRLRVLVPCLPPFFHSYSTCRAGSPLTTQLRAINAYAYESVHVSDFSPCGETCTTRRRESCFSNCYCRCCQHFHTIHSRRMSTGTRRKLNHQKKDIPRSIHRRARILT